MGMGTHQVPGSWHMGEGDRGGALMCGEGRQHQGLSPLAPLPKAREANNQGPSLALLFSSTWDLSTGGVSVPARSCVG